MGGNVSSPVKSGAIREPPDYNEADVSLLKGATDATDADDYGESSTSTLDGEAYVITDATNNSNRRHNCSGDEAYVITHRGPSATARARLTAVLSSGAAGARSEASSRRASAA